ncbi:hypothetical protein TcasGA2_TC004172 [Tribolium castaneum]|uniref:Uncharacterized protein n=1 Tax=Tribolium castaneum TaxID=7070 RepID=D7EJB9_TRICA|nr:hypothetical protein TcasGA2_TC004172 [Tribolium castaneum]
MAEEQTSDEKDICVNMNEEIDLEEAPLRMVSAATKVRDSGLVNFGKRKIALYNFLLREITT